MRRGLTLLEAMVIVAVVGILLWVILASMSGTHKVNWQAQSPTVADAAPLPEPGYVVDETGTLDSVQRADLQQRLVEQEAEGHEMAILIVDSTGSLSIEEYSIRIAEKWKVGNADRDDGILIVVAKSQRKVRIEVGTGAEGYVTDAEAGDIIRSYITPNFKMGDFHGGLRNGVEQLAAQFHD